MYKVINPKKIQIFDPQQVKGRFQEFDEIALKSIRDRIDLINAERSNLPPVARLKNLLTWISDVFKPFEDKSVCEKGCAFCCTMAVDISETEAKLISTPSKKNKPFAEAIKQHVTDIEKSQPCPFLNVETATCSIYDVRPLECRLFMTFDWYEYCREKDIDHAIIRANEVCLVLFNAVKNRIGQDIACLLSDAFYELFSDIGRDREIRCDIRQYF